MSFKKHYKTEVFDVLSETQNKWPLTAKLACHQKACLLSISDFLSPIFSTGIRFLNNAWFWAYFLWSLIGHVVVVAEVENPKNQNFWNHYFSAGTWVWEALGSMGPFWAPVWGPTSSCFLVLLVIVILLVWVCFGVLFCCRYCCLFVVLDFLLVIHCCWFLVVDLLFWFVAFGDRLFFFIMIIIFFFFSSSSSLYSSYCCCSCSCSANTCFCFGCFVFVFACLCFVWLKIPP